MKEKLTPRLMEIHLGSASPQSPQHLQKTSFNDISPSSPTFKLIQIPSTNRFVLSFLSSSYSLVDGPFALVGGVCMDDPLEEGREESRDGTAFCITLLTTVSSLFSLLRQ